LIKILKETYNFDDEFFSTYKIPSYIPITNNEEAKKYWSINIIPSKESNIIYKHTDEEIIKIKKLFDIILESNGEIETLLYDPDKEKVLVTAKRDDSNPIGHPIMILIKTHSNNLVNLNNDKLLGSKNEKSPFIYYLDNYMDQYYCHNFYVITLRESCFMCSMALMHSRIGRVYFMEDNTKDGALVSKLKINNYENINHEYLIFKYYEQ
jgi:tRNA-specific adenosine deaminase 3